MKTLLSAAALAAALVTAPSAAIAQRAPGAVVIVVDTARIFRECTACRAAQATLQGQITALQTRQQTLATQLRTEGQPIQTAVDALNGRQPDAALRARIEAFQKKQNDANQELQRAQQNIQSIQANVLRQINARLNPIITTVMTQKGANVAIDVEATLAHAGTVNATNDVLAQLNSQLPSVSVTPLPQQQQQQPQGR